MRKFELLSRTIDDEIVRDGLCGIATLSGTDKSRGLYFVTTGIAAQSYLPSSCRRTTCDIDVAVGRPLTYGEFRDFSSIVREYLQDLGYDVELKKSHLFYNLLITKDGEALLIEFSRRNRNNFERLEKRLERELSNARTKLVEERDATYVVASPEDVIAPKLARNILAYDNRISAGKGDNYHDHLGMFSRKLSDEEIVEILRIIEEKRKNIKNGSIGELRFLSDLYDIRMLSELAGINETYFRRAIGDWPCIQDKSRIRDQLILSLLPNLYISN